MNEPRRLLDEAGASGDARRLLLAGVADGPPADARQRAVVAVMAGATLAGAGAGAASAALHAKIVLGLKIAGALLASALLVAAVVIVRPHLGAAPLPSASPAPTASVEVLAVAPSATEAPVVAPVASEAPSIAVSSPAASSLPAPAPKASAVLDDDVDAEVHLLDEARHALAAGRSSQSLEALDRYARRFPKGAMTQEAAVLRIEALFAGGNATSACKAARTFLAKNTQSPHAGRVRTLQRRCEDSVIDP